MAKSFHVFPSIFCIFEIGTADLVGLLNTICGEQKKTFAIDNSLAK